jgi:hypothetical protein
VGLSKLRAFNPEGRDWDCERTGSHHEPHEPGLREDQDCERIGTARGPGLREDRDWAEEFPRCAGPPISVPLLRPISVPLLRPISVPLLRPISVPLLRSCCPASVPTSCHPIGPPATQWLLAAPIARPSPGPTEGFATLCFRLLKTGAAPRIFAVRRHIRNVPEWGPMEAGVCCGPEAFRTVLGRRTCRPHTKERPRRWQGQYETWKTLPFVGFVAGRCPSGPSFCASWTPPGGPAIPPPGPQLPSRPHQPSAPRQSGLSR